MAIFQILFVLVNMAIPSWVYFRSERSHEAPQIKWGPWEDNMGKILQASGGFAECSTADVIGYVRQLCEKSLQQWTDDDSVTLERASSSMVISCEVRADATFVQLRLENTDDFDIKCKPGQARGLHAAPAFVFNHKGELDAIEFSARNGKRQSVNAANCRRKFQLTLTRKPAVTQSDVDRMPRLKSDPADYVTANWMCFHYVTRLSWKKPA